MDTRYYIVNPDEEYPREIPASNDLIAKQRAMDLMTRPSMLIKVVSEVTMRDGKPFISSASCQNFGTLEYDETASVITGGRCIFYFSSDAATLFYENGQLVEPDKNPYLTIHVALDDLDMRCIDAAEQDCLYQDKEIKMKVNINALPILNKLNEIDCAINDSEICLAVTVRCEQYKTAIKSMEKSMKEYVDLSVLCEHMIEACDKGSSHEQTYDYEWDVIDLKHGEWFIGIHTTKEFCDTLQHA